jgi:hypothetical protein
MYNVVNGTNDALSLTVLLRGVGARHAKVNTVGEEERAGGGVVKLTVIIALNGPHSCAQLSMHEGKEMSERGEGV